MQCPRELEPERKHQEASASLDEAVKKLYERIGICPKEEFPFLRLNLDAAWCALEQARSELAQHKHCCLNGGEFSCHTSYTSPHVTGCFAGNHKK
jgi:hypothetical protein